MGDPVKIVIVEDEGVVAMDLRGQLERMGYEVVGTASRASVAIDLARGSRPDLVLMDIQLAGGRTGIEAAGVIRETSRIPVVFLTAYADDSSLALAKEVSPYGYIVKPFDDQDLKTTIEIALARARVESALDQSRADLMAVLDSQRQGSVTVDAGSRVTFVSRSVEELLGVSRAELTGSRWQEILPVDRAVIDRVEGLARRSENGRQKIAADIAADERQIAIEIEVVADPRDEGGFILFLYDVSDVQELRALLDGQTRFEKIIGSGKKMRAMFQLIEEVGSVDSPVLIEGETGTGKELVAQAIHRRSERKQGPFVPVNCGALTAELAASQLFGHRRGSFTGAISDHQGFFAAAEGGTLFLDEIGELPQVVQPTLLRTLDDGQIMPVGETAGRQVDFRLVAATSRSLTDEIEQQTFRSDLFYRLSVVRIQIPSLRERLEDLPILARSFLAEARAKTGKDVREIGTAAMSVLLQYPWPGNVRQLKNALEFATIRSTGSEIEIEHLPPEISSVELDLSESASEEDRIRAALARTRGNKKEAAKLLGMSRSTFYRRLDRL